MIILFCSFLGMGARCLRWSRRVRFRDSFDLLYVGCGGRMIFDGLGARDFVILFRSTLGVGV